MSRFYSVEMAKTVSQHAHISLHSTFFGLIHTATYDVTGSRVEAQTYFFQPLEGEELLSLMAMPDAEAAREADRLVSVNPQPYGNYRLDVCLSRDHQFLSMQLYQFREFMYRPVTEVRSFEGEPARHIVSLFDSRQ